MKKSLITFFSLILFVFSAQGQKNEKELQKKIWYCSSSIGSDSVLISADNTNKPTFELKFSKTGKLLSKNIRKKSVDSSETYIIKKNRLIIAINMKDSVETLEYSIKKVSGKKAFQLIMAFSSRYIKHKGDDTITLSEFSLLQGKKRKTIEYEQGLTVFSQKKALHNDSIDLAVWGQFVGYISDTILVDSDQYVIHNFYKKHTDTLHYIAPLLLDTVIRIKIPIKEITGIYTQREPFTSYTTGATILAMGIGLLSVATSVIVGENATGTVLAQTGVVSLLTIPFSFGTGMLFSTQKFLLKSNTKNKRTWTIERHMPNLVITERNKKKIINTKR